MLTLEKRWTTLIHDLKKDKMKDKIVHAALLGLSVGDALGVPMEFKSREEIRQNPVKSMRGFGTHNQPAGTWSDDSSLAFCLAASLCKGYDIFDIAENFVQWYDYNFWTPHGVVFDIGIATSNAIRDFRNNANPYKSGGINETDNGNGSLMRILPIVFYLKDKTLEERFKIISEVSGITHRHIRSVVACFIYIEFALNIIAGSEKFQAYNSMQILVNQFLKQPGICPLDELNKFHRILENPIMDYEILPLIQFPEDEIYSTGYVLSTLEASLWCILKTDNYSDAVLKAVNLGHDTDTTACVTGGLAGLLYGYDAISETWISQLARLKDIEELSDKLTKKYILK